MNKKKKLFLVLFQFFVFSNVLAEDYYFTDTFGNEIDYIYANVNNYFSIKTRDNSPIFYLGCSEMCFYNQDEIKVNPKSTSRIFIYVVLERDMYNDNMKIDTLTIGVKYPFPLSDFEINVSFGDTIPKLKYNTSIKFNVHFGEEYKLVTKFEENVFFVSYIHYTLDKCKVYVVINRKSYYEYELLFSDEIFRRKRENVYLNIVPFVREGNTLEPILHREIHQLIEIEIK